MTFFERYGATEAELQAYVAGLPVWVNVWRGWMFLVFSAAVLFVIWKSEARWLLLTMIVSLFLYNVVSMRSGVGRFPSIALVVFWAPLALYLFRRRPLLPSTGRFDRLYAWWVTASLVTLSVSVAFDVYNVGYSLLAGVP
jgi:hypothetical protein